MEASAIETKVLVCDDQTKARRGLGAILSSRGLRVRLARSGAEALSKAADAQVGVILMDIKMWGEYDGIDAAKLIRQRHPEKSVIFVTAFSQEYRDRIKTAGLSNLAIVSKPLIASSTKDNFVDLVSTALAEYQADSTDAASREDVAEVFALDTIDLLLYKELCSHPGLLKSLDWRLFERLLADILETFGYTVELTQGTKDGGIDIVAIQRTEDWGEHRYLLQAKRWSDRVGIEPVQRLLFLHSHTRATKSCLATTSTFTRGAWGLSREYGWQLDLRDFEGLKKWIAKALAKKLGATQFRPGTSTKRGVR